MRHIGFMGGSSLVELGTASEMIDFLDFLNTKMEDHESNEISRRLYNKYIKFEQLEKLDSIVKNIKLELSSDEGKYFKYLSGIETCIESAKMFYNSWKIYQPLKVAVTDAPYYIEDKNRPLEQYDVLKPDETPFWLR
ncbi:hypothetical protein [Pantoea vagans]|uniref:hypothetical protein n=1 Tax=Pantoea vagans TaxID=470934 RepID=UPI0023AF4BF5|nr:hypothetical protein [Pantoea vagans]MDE8558615.1 hypothetical protein [Pantoea vagans]MDE8578620.1 hypothetical protein [Pantoea vagans]